ncbi:pyruvate kinase [Halobacteriaceae archaeon SHR40]|uniref:pyruvate kinase n=1 Tax=Halovenus amylolytica TaxID=2500550 RepID=UPI000FE442AB
MSRRAKIVCTLGPASDDKESIAALANSGMSVARLNASHGSPDQRRELIDRIRSVDEEIGTPIGIMHDMPGPEIRTAESEEGTVFDEGDEVPFVPGGETTPEQVGVSKDLSAAEAGDRILLDDGRLEATVTRVDGETVYARFETGGTLESRKGVNVPGVDLGLPPVTEKDRQEMDVAADKKVDFMAASFVSSAADIYEISSELEDRDANIPIIAKIERVEAVENIDEIIDAADGIMVARGDLGVEIPLEDVPIIQKQIIRKCQRGGVPVITATEMLDSMIHNRRPTRAEASDVANAVLDGTDAVMLSGETAIGDHPAEVVDTMDRIVRDVEESDEYAETLEQRVPPAGETRTDALARSARYLARDTGASAITVASESGYTARKAAKYRPNIPVVAATPTERVKRQLTLAWGIIPRKVEYVDDTDSLIRNTVQSALDAGSAESGDTVVVLSGMMTDHGGYDTADMLKVHVASERLAAGRSVVSGFATGPLHRVSDGDLSDVPDGALVAVPESFDGEFTGELSKVAGIVDAHEGMTGYAAIVARELEIPMISNATVPEDIEDGEVITLDGERGVIYADRLEDESDVDRAKGR